MIDGAAMTSRAGKVLRIGAYILLAAAFLVSSAAALLRYGSVWRLHQIPKVPPAVQAPKLGNPVEGARLAAVVGCTGCHGKDLGGDAECFSEPGLMSLVCPNITEVRERYTDTDLVTLLRHGRKKDGAIVDFMPWDMYAHLTDKDLGDVLAFVRATPRVVKPAMPVSNYSWSIRWQMLRGTYPPQNDMSDYDATPLEGPAERGRYLASVACTECHAPSLRGYEGDIAPSLAVAKAYTPEAFARLMREGITLAGTQSATGMMSGVARWRFSHLHPEEVAALKAYLDQRAP